MVKEFRDFVLRGNLVELAVAFIMGVAFRDVVNAFTGRIVSPVIGLVFDIPDLANLWAFGEVDDATGLPSGSVGAFVEATLDFVLVALVLFFVVKAYNRAMERFREAEEEDAGTEEPAEDIALLREIRDALNR